MIDLPLSGLLLLTIVLTSSGIVIGYKTRPWYLRLRTRYKAIAISTILVIGAGAIVIMNLLI